MTRTYLTSPDSGHYLRVYGDGEILETHAGSDVGCCHPPSFLPKYQIEHPEYKLMNEEQFEEWENKALIMRELTEDKSDRNKNSYPKDLHVTLQITKRR